MRPATLTLAAVLAAPLAGAEQGAEADPRTELRSLEAALTRAADAVARPGVFALQAPACRGYRITGVGVVFVLPPRVLRTPSVFLGPRPGARTRRIRIPLELDREIRIIERQAEALQREALLAHQEMERAVAVVELELQRRHPVEAPLAALAPEVPTAPEAPTAREAARPATAPEPPKQPDTPLPTPPWMSWFDAGLDDEPAESSAAAVVPRMRDALIETLSSHGSTLHAIEPEETIAAAVDFLPGLGFGGAKVEKTLVVRIRKRDLDERRAGRIGPEELKARVAVAEY